MENFSIPDTSFETTFDDTYFTSPPSVPARGLRPRDLLAFKIAEKLYPISTIALCCLGTLGNALSIAVLSRKTLRGSPSSVSLRALAVSDTLVLWTYTLDLVLRLYEPQISKAWVCKLVFWLESAGQQISSYLVVVMSTERLIAVVWPLKVGALFTRKLAFCICIGVIVALLALNAPYFLFIDSWKGVVCYVNRRTHNNLFITWSKIDFSITLCIPALLILILNILIIDQLRRAKSRQRMLQGAGQDTSDKAQDQTGQITRMLLTISGAYWLLNLPFALFFIGSQYAFNLRSAYGNALAYLVQHICIFLLLTNNSINFYLYCVTGKWFRQELKTLVCRKRKRAQQVPAIGTPGIPSPDNAPVLPSSSVTKSTSVAKTLE